MRRVLGLFVALGILFTVIGCRHVGERRPLFGRKPPPPPPVQRPVIVQEQPVVVQPGLGQPPAFPTVPQGDPKEAVPSISKSITGDDKPSWRPMETLEPPARRDSKYPESPGVQLFAPEQLDKDENAKPAVKKPTIEASLPPIPQFADVRGVENAYSGLRPGLDGLDWLQTNRVGTVIQLRRPSDDDASDQKQVEARKMRYIGFEISPQTLTKEKADEFIKLIRDHSKQGIFVHDQDGSLAGAMWYLYFRQGDFLSDDASQIRARELGLQYRDGPHREMWLAVQKLLSESIK